MIYTSPPDIKKLVDDPFKTGDTKPIIVPVLQEDKKPVIKGYVEKLDEMSGGLVSKASESLFKAGRGEIHTLLVDGRVVYLVGVGDKADHESYRRALAKSAKQVLDKYEEVVLVLEDIADSDVASEALLGFLLGSYTLEYFKSEKKNKLKVVHYAGDVDETYVRALAEAVFLARDVANAPPNDLYPERLAEKVKELFSKTPNVEVEVFDYEKLVKEGFGGIVNVGSGSSFKPRLIILHYKGSGGEDSSGKIALVGKTLVFDAGGIQVKPGHTMTDMYADKAGGAAVLGIIWAASKLGLNIDLYGLLSAAINTLDGEAYLPSYVIKMWDGTRVDVGHTDAEGRLVIADAISYAAKELNADIIIDLATLTGAAVVALGPLMAALFTKDKELEEAFKEASEKTGELLWPLPMADVYKPLLTKNARLGDISNVGGRWGGAIYGALFLERFSHGKRFVHLDIAGPGIGGGEAASIAPDYWPGRHAPGYGVRLVLEVLRRLKRAEE
ncbi:MAG: leucyl aminopeptidase family protein [Desulfurococcales archaeon]|nr:leucyl aminopeptidase family protein [Desulfurococcales archaeon]